MPQNEELQKRPSQLQECMVSRRGCEQAEADGNDVAPDPRSSGKQWRYFQEGQGGSGLHYILQPHWKHWRRDERGQKTEASKL